MFWCHRHRVIEQLVKKGGRVRVKGVPGSTCGHGAVAALLQSAFRVEHNQLEVGLPQ
jgi:hypothetical protein